MKNALQWIALAIFFGFLAWFVLAVSQVNHGG